MHVADLPVGAQVRITSETPAGMAVQISYKGEPVQGVLSATIQVAGGRNWARAVLTYKARQPEPTEYGALPGERLTKEVETEVDMPAIVAGKDAMA